MGKEIYRFEDVPVMTGRVTARRISLNSTRCDHQSVLARGQERFNIYCAPCHGKQGDGNGIVKKVVPAANVATCTTSA